MNRHRWIWAGFALCLAAGLGAMGLVTHLVLSLERQGVQAQSQSAADERARLALWRMELRVAGILAREAAWGVADVRTESAAALSPEVQLHFCLTTDGRLTGPEGDPARAALARLQAALAASPAQTLIARLEEPEALPAAPATSAPTAVLARNTIANNVSPSLNVTQTPNRNSDDYSQRLNTQMQFNGANISNTINAQGAPNLNQAIVAAGGVCGPLKALWLGDELVLARRVRQGARESVQGCLLNWSELRRAMLDDVSDLVPGAELIASDPRRDDPRDAFLLAGLPLRLLPAAVAEPDRGLTGSPLRLSLTIAWVCLLLAGAAGGALLGGVMALSQRRSTFVSAVTHELRTPLTSFRLYTDLLASGQVTDPTKQAEYTDRLAQQARRLGHLVENVLAFSRLSQGRGSLHVETLPMGRLVERALPALRERAASAGMTLEVKTSPSAEARAVRADISAVEQILLNLVDNACKYAGRAENRRIELELDATRQGACLRVRDHGPGVDASLGRRLFRPFGRSAQEAAGSAPGVGLGLAISRRLARAMGGDLRLEPPGEGACFVLQFRPGSEQSA